MTVAQSEAHTKAVALALYQIRILLSGYLGTSSKGDISVRQAAHLAYASHNEALAILPFQLTVPDGRPTTLAPSPVVGPVWHQRPRCQRTKPMGRMEGSFCAGG